MKGRFGQALYFSGKNDFVEIPDSDSLTKDTEEITILAWVHLNRPVTESSWSVIVSKKPFPYGYLMWIEKPTQPSGLVFSPQRQEVRANFQLKTEQWYHLGFTRAKNGDMKFYIDGELVTESKGESGPISTKPSPIIIAGQSSNQPFDGKIDEVILFKKPLDINEINQLMKQGFDKNTLGFPAIPIDIPGPNLRAALEKALGKNDDDDITKEDLEKLTELVVNGENLDKNEKIKDITGLENCLDLVHLKLNSNRISDIKSLANLSRLTQLNLGHNNLSNLKGLGEKTDLSWLNLVGNQLNDLDAIKTAISITWLDLSQNRLTQISSLSKLTKLTYLDLYNNQITDITPLIENTGISGTINLKSNPLNNTALSTHIPALEARGIKVEYDGKPPMAKLSFSKPDRVHVDQVFTVNALVDKVPNLAGWTVAIEYNPSLLELQSVKEGDALQAEGKGVFFQQGKINSQSGTLTGLSSVYLGIGGVEASGVLATLTFKAIKDGESYLRFKKVEFGGPKGQAIPMDVEGTTITLFSVPPCDVNADGTINIFDLILVGQAFGQEVKTRVDTNGDGTVNIFDLIAVAQCFGQGAAPAIVSQPVAMFAMVENWVHLAEAADDGSVAFDQGIAVLKEILSSIKPAETVLMANYPNPFNPETWIPYHLSQDAEVVVRIYDVRGRIVRTLDMGFQSFGYYASRDKAAYWNGKTDTGEVVSSGTYFYQIQAEDYTEIRKMVILK